MKQQPPTTDAEVRRARARRTAWIIAIVALAIFAGSIIEALVMR